MTRVMIIGGGIGGLALAQGLRRAGLPATVFERTQQRTDWLQGYRIHISPHGSRALRDCLAPANWQSFLDTVSADSNGFAFVTQRMRPLLELEHELINPSRDPAARHYGVSRIVLREILLDGLDDIVQLGKTFIRYEVEPDGSVTAHFADGTASNADLLVGADGANSRVRAQLLPHAERVDTGVLAIAGKHPLDGLPPSLTERVNLVLPPRHGSLFTAVWRAGGAGDYALWGFADAVTRFPDTDGLDGRQLIDLTLDRMRGWSPVLHELVGGSDPGSVNVVRMRSAALIKPWETGPVTLMGDAIHSMTPMAGIGANTALRDADLLRRKLVEALPVREAVRAYEREMFGYAFAAVRRSWRNARQAGSGNRLGRAAFRGVLRLTGAVPPLKRRMARTFGS